MLRDMGYSALEVDAVLALNPSKLNDLTKRLAAVRAFMALPEATSLTAANKRIVNILKKAEGEAIPETVDPARFVEPAEVALWDKLQAVAPEAQAHFASGNFEAMLTTLAVLKDAVDSFFESVMVNADDPALRMNRHALLKALYEVMNKVAEISRLA